MPLSHGARVRIPALGLGVYKAANGEECVKAVTHALKVGYRHIDTAKDYGNEQSVGEAIRASGVPRSEVIMATLFSCFLRFALVFVIRFS